MRQHPSPLLVKGQLIDFFNTSLQQMNEISQVEVYAAGGQHILVG